MQKTKYPMVWDLSAMYAGVNDPKIFKDLEEFKKTAEQFERKHRGKVAGYSDKQVLAFIRLLEQIQERWYVLSAYIELKFAENTKDQAVNSVMQRIEVAGTEIGNHYVFVNLELAQHPQLQRFGTDPKFAPYNIIFQDLAEVKKHQLSHAEETVLNLKAIPAHLGWVKLFEKTTSESTFAVKLKGKRREISEEELLSLLRTEQDRAVRKQLSETFSSGLDKNGALATQVYNMLLLDKMQDDRLRKFEYPEQARHIDNGVSKKTVDAMVAATRNNFKLVSRYYQIKRKLLGLNKLYDYDRYTPVSEARLAGKKNLKRKSYSYDQAIETVDRSFRNFDPEFAEIFLDLVTGKHMHAVPAPGKRSGAFCMFMPKEIKPFVMMSFFGIAEDVGTIAHEMGHAVHDVLQAGLPFLVRHAPLALAETASVFGEMVVFENLLASAASREEKIVLLTEKIDGVIATIFRQTSMFMFEQLAHNHVKQNGEVSFDQLNQYWMQTQQQMYGNSVELTDGYKYWWSYIPHFMHTPFYVYAYAFGNLLVLSLYEQYKQGVPDFVSKYKQLLASGGSKHPQQAVAPFGFDLESEKFWNSGFAVFAELIKQLENLV